MIDQEGQSRIQYLSCGVKSHEGEMLNLVCVGCQEGGLICSLCREQHRNHRVIPLKILIHNFKNNSANAPGDDEYCSKMQQLQNLKNSMLYELKCCVETVAQYFEKLEQDIIDSYNSIKLQVVEEIQLGLEIDALLQKVVAGTISPAVYIDNIKKLARYVKPKGEKEFVLTMDFDRFLRPFKETHQGLSANMRKIQQFIESIATLPKLKDIKEQVAAEVPKGIEQKYQYRFSSTLKTSFIQLNDKRTIATQSQTQSGRFVLIEEGMGVKHQKITFKIVALKNWIGIGVCLKDKIAAVNYQFKYENMGHGSFLLSNNGYTWSHCFPEDNIHSTLFTFKQDNIVELTLEPKELTFKLNDNPTPFKLKIDFKEDEWPKVCFCANLCSQDDCLEILDQ